jgi:phosphohistidine phosphatase SixA
MILTLIRHADALRDAHYADIDRPLSDVGLEQAEALAARWQPLLAKSQWQVSSAQRTQQTAQAFAVDYQPQPGLYEAGVVSLLMFLRSQPQQDTVVVAHNPTLSELARYLTDQPLPEMETAELRQFNIEAWERGGGVLLPAP